MQARIRLYLNLNPNLNPTLVDYDYDHDYEFKLGSFPKDASPNSATLLSYFANKTWTSFTARPRAQIMPTAPQKSSLAVLK